MNNWKKGKNSPRFVDYSLLTQPKRRAMIPVSSDPLILPRHKKKEPLYNH